MKKLLLFLLVIMLSARENPFAPVVTNKNNNIIKKQFFTSKKLTFPSDARVLKSVILKYQAVTGSIKTIEFPINQNIDWHNPLILKSLQKTKSIKSVKVKFLTFYIKNHKVLIQTNDELLRNFFLVKPFRYVIDFKANKNFLTYTKKTDTFIQKIVIGNHSGFYRVVLYLDGIYKPVIQKEAKGYLIDFK